MRDIGHFIGGKTIKSTSGRTGDVFDPNTGEVQAKVALASKSEVEAAIANAAAAQPAWAATNPQRRARVMFKFLELVAKENRQPGQTPLLRAWQNRSRRQRRHPARRRGRGIRLRHSASIEGRDSPKAPVPASIFIPCASRSASSPALRRSISRR